MSRSKIFLFCALVLLSFGICVSTWALQPDKPQTELTQKEFFRPELSITITNEPYQNIGFQLANQADWADFFTRFGTDVQVYVDSRSRTPTNIITRVPMIPGKGSGNRVSLGDVGNRLGRVVNAVTPDVVADLVLQFVLENQGALAIDSSQLGEVRSVAVRDSLWHVNFPQQVHGIPVRYGRLSATLNHGNLIMIGTESWGNARVDTRPAVDSNYALQAGFAYAGGRRSVDAIVREPQLEIIPYAAEAVTGGPREYGHYLTWGFHFQRPPDHAIWEVLVNAHTGEILSFQDTNHYIEKKITGGVYPVTSTEICPTPGTCGTMQDAYPMPWANTGLASPNDFTDGAGVFDYTSGTVTTTLSGRYVRISDTCGVISASAAGDIDLGGVNGQHDCTSSGFSAGNTASSRSCFYEVNKLAELARGWLPTNTWLQSQLTANVNLNNTCNAFYSTGSGTINFYRSGGGCRNTGEIAAVFDHEWGHGMDHRDSGGFLSNSSEAYADIAMIYRLHTSCIGHGFWWTSNRGCGTTADGTGYNANEAQTGASHCDLDCSGVRDADWDKHANHTPDTPQNFVCGSCLSSSGPCGRQVHCAAAPSRQAAWDFAARDLQSAPFNYDSNTAFVVANRVFYQGSGNIGLWHDCNCTSGTSSGCGSTSGYMSWLAADDDNGNLSDGTPHMTALYNAFNRHNIACSTPTPQNSGCSGGPTGVPNVTATPGSFQVGLSWNSVANASSYWVLRTEGHAGCDLGKALIAEVTGTSYTDSEVADGRPYSYVVMAVGSNSDCYAPASSCVTATPTSGGGGCNAPSGLPNNTAADVNPCADTGVEITWPQDPGDWGDSGGTRTYDVLRDGSPLAGATGITYGTTSHTDLSGTNGQSYSYSVRYNNGCGSSATTAGASATDDVAGSSQSETANQVSSLQAKNSTVSSTLSPAFSISKVDAASAGINWTLGGNTDLTNCAAVTLVGPAGGERVLKAVGDSDAGSANVLSFYKTEGPGTYSVELQELASCAKNNRNAQLNSSQMTVETAGACGGNNPPVASFTYSCNLLACNFMDTSTDSDGTINTWSWDFGDGGADSVQDPSHTFTADGTYNVTLEVEDNGGATDDEVRSVTVSATNFVLTTSGYKVQGVHHADLSWNGNSGAVDIYRDGKIVLGGTAVSGNTFTDNIGQKGGNVSYIYQVCETGSTTDCSNTSTVFF